MRTSIPEGPTEHTRYYAAVASVWCGPPIFRQKHRQAILTSAFAALPVPLCLAGSCVSFRPELL